MESFLEFSKTTRDNWFHKQRTVYSNYHLFGFPYTLVQSIPDLDEMKEGFFAGDELWLWIDCIHPNVYISTSKGTMKAEESFFNNPFLSLDFTNGKIIEANTIAQHKRFLKPNEKMIKVSTRTRNIITSKNHRFFTINRDPNFWNRHKDNNPLDFTKEQKAKTLRKGDRVLMVHKLPEPKKKLIEPKLAQLLGYITADGNIEYTHRNSIHIDDESLKCLKKYEKIAEKLGFSTSIHKLKNVNCHRLRLFKKKKILELVNKIQDATKINKNLSCPTTRIIDIPKIITESNNKVLGAFLNGFFDGDAYPKIENSLQKKFGKIILVNSNKKLIEKIKYLLLRFGIESKIRKCKGGREHTYYRLTIRDSYSIKQFKKHIGFLDPKKQTKLKKIPTNFKSKRRIFDDYEIGYITNVKEIKCNVPYLIDFSVPLTENYIANGFIIHNSWGGKSEKQKLISSIILKSRKRSITIAYTSQSISQVVKRIRDITDFVSYPMLGADDSYCRTEVFRGPKVLPEGRIKPPLYFNTEPVIAMFNSYEEVKPIANKKTKFREMYQPIWENPAWRKYLKWEHEIINETEFMMRSKAIQSAINPNGYTSEKQREEIKPEFYPI